MLTDGRQRFSKKELQLHTGSVEVFKALGGSAAGQGEKSCQQLLKLKKRIEKSESNNSRHRILSSHFQSPTHQSSDISAFCDGYRHHRNSSNRNLYSQDSGLLYSSKPINRRKAKAYKANIAPAQVFGNLPKTNSQLLQAPFLIYSQANQQQPLQAQSSNPQLKMSKKKKKRARAVRESKDAGPGAQNTTVCDNGGDPENTNSSCPDDSVDSAGELAGDQYCYKVVEAQQEASVEVDDTAGQHQEAK